jgi:hypothetical protein
VVALERDQQGENSNESLIRILKNREFGEVGEADTVIYKFRHRTPCRWPGITTG